jgi:translation initiation factor 5B
MRKEGKLLTDKQKKERAAAEIRKQALLQAGGLVEGLQKHDSPIAGPSKKVVYGKRQRGPAQKKEGSVAGSSTPSTPAPPEPMKLEPEPEPEPAVAAPVASGVEKDWDASSGGEAEEKDDVKDDWDASSGDEAKAAKKLAGKLKSYHSLQQLKYS